MTMTAKEAEEAAKKARDLVNAFEHLSRQREVLNRVVKYTKGGGKWKIDLMLHRDLPYGYREVTYEIPVQHVVQQCIDRVTAAEREVIRLGGTP